MSLFTKVVVTSVVVPTGVESLQLQSPKFKSAYLRLFNKEDAVPFPECCGENENELTGSICPNQTRKPATHPGEATKKAKKLKELKAAKREFLTKELQDIGVKEKLEGKTIEELREMLCASLAKHWSETYAHYRTARFGRCGSMKDRIGEPEDIMVEEHPELRETFFANTEHRLRNFKRAITGCMFGPDCTREVKWSIHQYLRKICAEELEAKKQEKKEKNLVEKCRQFIRRLHKAQEIFKETYTDELQRETAKSAPDFEALLESWKFEMKKKECEELINKSGKDLQGAWKAKEKVIWQIWDLQFPFKNEYSEMEIESQRQRKNELSQMEVPELEQTLERQYRDKLQDAIATKDHGALNKLLQKLRLSESALKNGTEDQGSQQNVEEEEGNDLQQLKIGKQNKREDGTKFKWSKVFLLLCVLWFYGTMTAGYKWAHLVSVSVETYIAIVAVPAGVFLALYFVLAKRQQ